MHIKSALLFSLLISTAFAKSTYHADYAIVGVGTAGAVLAKKLSDDKETSVIALHTGDNLTNEAFIKYASNVFITVPSALAGPPIAETGETIPQPNADDRQLTWVLSMPFGGASAINAGAWCRGTNQVYSQWEQIAGKKWSPKRITKLYKELEKYHGETHNPEAHGFHGPLSIRQVPHVSKVAHVFSKALKKATGFPFVLDYNDPKTPIGISSKLQYTQHGHHGKFRESSVISFLDDDVVSPNGYGRNGRKLRILFNSFGLRTIWKNNKAIGVEFVENGKTKKVYAKKGVIVCAGLRSSPFLMHSGIGPSSLLQSLGIPVKFNNPNVGQGLADQPSVRMLFSSNPNDASHDPNGLFNQISWLPTPGGNKKIRTLRIATITGVPGTTACLLDLCQPKSRGSVTINSPDPLAKPVIDLGMLNNPDDLATLQKGIQVYIKNLNAAIQKIDPSYRLVVPDPAILDDAALVQDFIELVIASNMHFQSHCRMADLNNGGVVDSHGRVYGVKHLFVADDSVVPLCMDGSPMATAYLIAANIAELLLEE